MLRILICLYKWIYDPSVKREYLIVLDLTCMYYPTTLVVLIAIAHSALGILKVSIEVIQTAQNM